MFKKILLAIDGSEQSKKAEEYAIESVKTLKGDITAINVVEFPAAIVGMNENMIYSQTSEEILYLDNMKKDSEEILNAFKAEAKNKGIKVAATSKIGHAWNEIIEESENGNYDLIILGSKGLSGIERMLIGSVAENVVRHSKCPVLIVK